MIDSIRIGLIVQVITKNKKKPLIIESPYGWPFESSIIYEYFLKKGIEEEKI